MTAAVGAAPALPGADALPSNPNLLPRTNSTVPSSPPTPARSALAGDTKRPPAAGKTRPAPAPPASSAPRAGLPPEALPSSNYFAAQASPASDQMANYQNQLTAAREERHSHDFQHAETGLIGLLQSDAPDDFKRSALLELAYLAQDQQKLPRAEQIFSQFLARFPNDAAAPEILLRQGLLYRQMGLNELAVAKFYAVMSTALNLNLDRLDYYKRVVLQAQAEIAETYYSQGKFADASDFFSRLLKDGSRELNKPLIQFKLIRSLTMLGEHDRAVAQAQNFVQSYPKSGDVPEVRFLLANSLKKLGHNHEAMEQVLYLLQSQSASAGQNPETWIYWQQRAGNDIANQLYKEGDYVSALQIYLTLADLDKTPSWQLPVWYQIGLVYERLQQPQKAQAMYDQILKREAELTGHNPSPSLLAVVDMAKWRRQYLAWLEKAQGQADLLRPLFHTNQNNIAQQ